MTRRERSPMSAVGLGALVRNSTFARIWAAIFLSAAATFLLFMSLLSLALEVSGSIPHANAIVLTQWLPAIIALPLIKRLAADLASKQALLLAELGCVAFTFLTWFVAEQYFALLGILLVRGAFDSLSKVARTTALRQYFTGELLDRAASYYSTALLMGGGVGSLLGLLLYVPWSIGAIIGLCTVLHALAAILYLSLPGGAAVAEGAGNGLAEPPLAPEWAIRRASIYFVACVSLFQGFHNFARTAYPITHLGLEESSISLVQMITIASYIIGALVAARIVLNKNYSLIGTVVHLATILALSSLPFFHGAAFGLGMYLMFGFLFEIGFCIHLRYVITASPRHLVGGRVANINASSTAIMVAVAYGGSVLYSVVGFDLTVLAVAVLALLVMPAEHFLSRMERNSAGNPSPIASSSGGRGS